MATLDLQPYRVNLILKTDSKELSVASPDIFELGDLGISHITLGTKTFEIEKKLGEGTYGTSYAVRSAEGKIYACKIIHDVYSSRQILGFFKESLINIILAEESKHMPNGPYVPYVVRLAYNPRTYDAFILTELMRNTLDNLITSNSRKDNDMVVSGAIGQVSRIMDFFGRTLKFNHRDMKGDNIMYIRNKDNNALYRLIDFGFSCITWNGIQISGNGYFDATSTCFKKDRDLSQLIYSILRYYGSYLSSSLYNDLSDIIVANVGAHVCKMEEDCPRHGLSSWKNTYNFLNRDNVSVPRGSPRKVIKDMAKFRNYTRRKKEIKRNIARTLKLCALGKIRNPKTGRCVTEHSKTGKHIKDPLEPPPPCPSEKIRNPKTRRCVKESGLTGRKIIMADMAAEGAPCPSGKIRNPKSGSCIKLSSAAREVLEA